MSQRDSNAGKGENCGFGFWHSSPTQGMRPMRRAVRLVFLGFAGALLGLMIDYFLLGGNAQGRGYGLGAFVCMLAGAVAGCWLGVRRASRIK